MRDSEHAAAAELAFNLGKTMRRAIDDADHKLDTLALSKIANKLLEVGDDKVANELLLVFVAGFEEGDPPERRMHPEDR